MRKAGAFDDILCALASPSGILQAEAVVLGAEVKGFGMDRKWRRVLGEAKSIQRANVLRVLAARGDRKTLPEIDGYLDSEDVAVRTAAIEYAGALGGETEMPGLMQMLANETVKDERAAAETAFAHGAHELDLPALVAGSGGWFVSH